MRIVTYQHNETSNLGLLLNDKIYSLSSIANTMNKFLQMGEDAMGKAKKLEEYMTIVRSIQKTSERDDMPSMGDILRLPDILIRNEPDDEDDLKKIFLTALKKALDEMGKIRQSEGENIQSDLIMRLSLIKNIVH